MTFNFRKAAYADKEKIEQLFIEMLREIYKTDDVKGYEEGDLDSFFEDRGSWICVAEAGEVTAAYLSMELHSEDGGFIYLDDISVSADYRNQGIGTQLIKIAEEYAEDCNVPAVVLHVEMRNESAIRLYRRLGYDVVSEEGSRYRMSKTTK